MKKLTIILPLVILMMLGMKSSVMAQDDIQDIQKFITMFKESYRAWRRRKYSVKEIVGESTAS